METIRLSAYTLASIIRCVGEGRPAFIVIRDKSLLRTSKSLYYSITLKRKSDGKLFKGCYTFSSKGFGPKVIEFQETKYLTNY